ncbi:hypothetical protein BpHYR1_042029 [Brachionus plicatilis]|uniref:Uncharacterized protein n=1 Tax=Brachionus plicatilis TaxID=10195 RepID=A0A3M7PT46_BRAPC|nr:hypothetical protein BpHYR1_042029 [Brachionus plicatilis]
MPKFIAEFCRIGILVEQRMYQLLQFTEHVLVLQNLSFGIFKLVVQDSLAYLPFVIFNIRLNSRTIKKFALFKLINIKICYEISDHFSNLDYFQFKSYDDKNEKFNTQSGRSFIYRINNDKKTFSLECLYSITSLLRWFIPPNENPYRESYKLPRKIPLDIPHPIYH